MKNWNGCKKEACKLWDLDGKHSCCKLDEGFEDVCVENGESFWPKPLEQVVEHEEMKEFTLLSLAVADIPYKKLVDFWAIAHRKMDRLPRILKFEELRDTFEEACLIPDLEAHGFIKRIEPEIKAGSWVMDHDGNIGHISNSPIMNLVIYWLDGRTQLADSTEGLRLIPDPIFQKIKGNE